MSHLSDVSRVEDPFEKRVRRDVDGHNTVKQRLWLRDPARLDRFYEELRALAASVHREIEMTPRHERALRRQLNGVFARVSERIVEVKPAVMELRRQRYARHRDVLWHAIAAHRDAHVLENIEPTEHDVRLWAVLEDRDTELGARI